MKKIVIICGPTAVGKTAVGTELSQKFGGEIVSADSGQVWRGFDIGTAKVMGGDVPHHLISVAEPDEHFDAAKFVKLADDAITDILARGRVPFVVGGTGMYIQMLVHGLCEAPPRDPDFRTETEAWIRKNSVAALHERLREVDPETARILYPCDKTRIIRALEIHHFTGLPASVFRNQHGFKDRRYDSLRLGLKIPRPELYDRINTRVDRMIAHGFISEVRSLVARYPLTCQPFSIIGYREIAAHLRGEFPLDEAVRMTKQNSRHFAKRQITWFKRDTGIIWFDPKEISAITGVIERFLN